MVGKVLIAVVVIAVVIVVLIVAVIGVVRRPARVLIPAEPASDAQAVALARAGQKLPAIKMILELHGIGLQEAKDWIEAALVSDAPMGSTASFQPPAAGTDEQVVRLARQGRKLEAIKLMRELHGVGLKEAKDFVDATARDFGRPASRPTTWDINGPFG